MLFERPGVRRLDGAKQARRVGRASQQVEGLHHGLIFVFREHDDASGILARDDKRHTAVANLIHVGGEFGAEFGLRYVTHGTRLTSCGKICT
jgi:hypothetical protein